MCNHRNTTRVEAAKEVAGLTFAYSALACSDCGSVLWSQETESQFQEWLGEQKRMNPEKFVVQKVQISEDLAAFAEMLAKKNHRSVSDVFQACLALYFVLGGADNGLRSLLDNINLGDAQPVVTKKFRVTPPMFVKLDANAKLFGLPLSDVASWIVQRVLWAACKGMERTREELEFALAA